jgi:hypothetical protein
MGCQSNTWATPGHLVVAAIAWPCPYFMFRHHPLLHGKPTTISTPLRQAIALGIRLGCPLQQIIATLLAWKLRGLYPDTAQHPGLRIYSLCKARTLFLGQTVNASFSCAVGALHPSCQQAPIGQPVLVVQHSKLTQMPFTTFEVHVVKGI